MTYATCKAIAISLFTMAFLLSASSLVLFIEDAPADDLSRTGSVVSQSAQVGDLAKATDVIQLAEPIKDEPLAMDTSHLSNGN